MKARAFELVVWREGAKKEGFIDKDLPTYLRTKLGWFDYKNTKEEPVNPKGWEWKYAVDAEGISREGFTDEEGKL